MCLKNVVSTKNQSVNFGKNYKCFLEAPQLSFSFSLSFSLSLSLPLQIRSASVLFFLFFLILLLLLLSFLSFFRFLLFLLFFIFIFPPFDQNELADDGALALAAVAHPHRNFIETTVELVFFHSDPRPKNWPF